MSDFKPSLQWAPKRPEYYVQTGSMFENPYGVPHDEIIRFILENPPEVVAQVVFGKYVEDDGLVFYAELIQSMVDRGLPRVIGNSYVDAEAVETAKLFVDTYPYQYRYFTGVDVARQTDYTVISVIDTIVKPARLVYWKRMNRVPWETIYGAIGETAAVFGKNVLVDGSGPGGDVVMDALESRYYCRRHRKTFLVSPGHCPKEGCEPEKDWIALSCCEPFHFTGTTKKQLVEHLRNVLSVGYDSTTPDVGFGWIRTPPIVQLVEELSFYTWDDKKLETDALFSLALAVWAGLEEELVAPHVGSPLGEGRS